MTKFRAGALAAGLMLAAISSFGAQAAMLLGSATLTGSQEVPPSGSEAVGTGSFDLDTTAGLITNLNLSVQGIFVDELMGAGAHDTPAHIHEAPFGENGSIIIEFAFSDVTETTNGFEINIASIAVTPSIITALLAGNTYFNVHTMDFPGGEIRGQIAVTPVPAGILLLGSALGGVGLVVSRRRS